MAESAATVEARAVEAGFSVLKSLDKSDDKSDEKGRFKGYTRSNISNRPYRQAKNKTWTVSRKNREAEPHEGMLETSQEAMFDPQCEGNWGRAVAGHPQHGESHG